MSGPLLQSQRRKGPRRLSVVVIRLSLLFLFLFSIIGLLTWRPWRPSLASGSPSPGTMSSPDGAQPPPYRSHRSIRDRGMDVSKLLKAQKPTAGEDKVVVVEETRKEELQPETDASPSDKHEELVAQEPVTSSSPLPSSPPVVIETRAVEGSHTPNITTSSDTRSELDEDSHKSEESHPRQLSEGMDQEQKLPRGLYALSALDIDGKEVSMSHYAGKVLLIVNVASKCGYTDQNYLGLEKTYQKYKKYGLEILAFPCNQFGGQEAGSLAEIKSFCTDKYHVSFPIFSKIEVNGKSVHPLYAFLKKELSLSEGGGGGEGAGKDLGWNFFKFLVDKKGRPVRLFSQNYNAAEVEGEIYRLIHDSGLIHS